MSQVDKIVRFGGKLYVRFKCLKCGNNETAPIDERLGEYARVEIGEHHVKKNFWGKGSGEICENSGKWFLVKLE